MKPKIFIPYYLLKPPFEKKEIHFLILSVLFVFLTGVEITKAEQFSIEKEILNAISPIAENTIWQAQTVIVTSDIIINDGVTLEIAAGTNVEFHGPYHIDVQGCLLAIGSQENPIKFHATDSAKEEGWRGIRFHNTADMNQFSRISYCEITDGKATGEDRQKYGGAIYINNYSNLIIENSLLHGNYAEIGGAIYCDNASITLTSNVIRHNKAKYSGGVHCYNYSDAFFANNLISDNEAVFQGGGISCVDKSNAILLNNKILRNHSNRGGGVFCRNNSAPQFYNNIVYYNISQNGGGIECLKSSPVFVNNNICYNNANSGGGVYCYESSPEFVNTIIWGNRASESGNSILVFLSKSELKMQHCIVEGGTEEIGLYFGAALEPANMVNVYNENPRFVNDTIRPYMINDASPCIDSGRIVDNINNYPTDIEGNERIVNQRIDIGVFEYFKDSIVENN